ncbi:hypothetical protein RAMDARK_0616 [Rickettsia amblyommatis str. Darkwater]|nr:hypothetical protein RAMDARK_0616 [Rickettsia amblyommatis str. Darkwater]
MQQRLFKFYDKIILSFRHCSLNIDIVIASSHRLRSNLVKYPEIASLIAMQFPRNDDKHRVMQQSRILKLITLHYKTPNDDR